MIKKIFITLFLSAIIVLQVTPQKTITLQNCYEAAVNKSALSAERELRSSILAVKGNNLGKNWLPVIDAGASFIYNSEVIDLGEKFSMVPVPGLADAIKPLAHEQYKITLDITQTIYDGGATKAAREIENKTWKVNVNQTEADLYKLRSQVDSYYFSVLMLDRRRESLESFLEVIEKRIAATESAVRNGLALPSDINLMKAEKIKILQQITEIGIRKNAMLKILSDLTGIMFEPQDKLVLPEISDDEISPGLQRPELEYFDLRKELLASSIKAAETKLLPKAYGFATLGYGNPPGNNFLKDEFAPYYILGAGIKWNIFDWNRTKNEKQILMLEQNILEKKKADLEENILRALEAKKAEIQSLESLLESDRELIRLRTGISAAAVSRYENGVITAAEMLSELNAEHQAKISHELHRINLAMAKAEYLNICGKSIR